MGKLLVICGATATGKSDLAVECAQKLGSEVVSADSQLVYRGLNIGTAKPTAAQMRGVPHHLIDVVDAGQNFTVCDYKERALPVIDRLLAEGKTPVVCGGTGFYINSILYDLGYGGAIGDPQVRQKYEDILQTRGKEYLYDLLKSVDGQSAGKLHPNDTKRVIRALEIFEATGKKKSEQNDKLISRYDYTAIALDYPRDVLYERINRRVDQMFEDGLVEEVEGLLSAGIDEKCQSMQAIGYKEVMGALKNGSLSSTTRDIIKQNTRRYAKRQITFFKKMENLVWLKPDECSADLVLEILNGSKTVY